MLTTQPILLAETNTEQIAISIELLEFLGEWQLENGDWIDPNEFTEIEDSNMNNSEETSDE